MMITIRSLALRGASLLAVAGLLGATPALAQSNESDAGTFAVYVGGRQVGTEEFSIVHTGAGANSEIVATGRVQLQLPSGTVDLAPRLRTSGFQASPVAYEVVVGGTSPRRMVGTIAEGRVSSRISTPAGEQMREYLASSSAAVLDEGVAHQYYFVARRLRNGELPIIVPRENRQVMATVADRGEESVAIGTARATLFHLVVTPRGGEPRHVWVDALGRVIKVEIPTRDYVAVRSQLPA